ncbi:MAG: hypothetical protein H6684_13315 [Deltaproteobacteria bacterium]|nr:hypothetical protein [Deltaproteobacteria bacterium]
MSDRWLWVLVALSAVLLISSSAIVSCGDDDDDTGRTGTTTDDDDDSADDDMIPTVDDDDDDDTDDDDDDDSDDDDDDDDDDDSDDDDDDDDDDDIITPEQLQAIEDGTDVCTDAYVDCELTEFKEDFIRKTCSGRFEHFKTNAMDIDCFETAVEDYSDCVTDICDPCSVNCTDDNINECGSLYLVPAQAACEPSGDDDDDTA